MDINGKLIKFVEQEMLERIYPNGNRYYGQSKDGKPNGTGVLICANGDKYTGSFLDGNIHGKGRIDYVDGSNYIGTWENNQRHGHGTLVNKEVGKYTGEFKLNRAHGRGITEYKNGDYHSGEYRNNQKYGRGLLVYSNGNRYVGDFKRGKYDGIGVEIFAPFTFYIGAYKEGVREGLGFVLEDDTSFYFGRFVNGKYQGRGIRVENNDNVYDGMFRENKYSGYGRYVEFFAGDFVKELMGSFMDDEVQGKAKTFYKDGSSLAAEYLNGMCSGEVIKKFPDGESRRQWMVENNFSMDFQGFLRGETQDVKGRYLSDIWSFNDEQIEFTHDFISLVFPLEIKSNNSSQYFYLHDQELINAIRADLVIRAKMLKSASWFLDYLKRNKAWQSRYNHNQFRITRIIRSLRLLVSDIEADKFYQNIINMLDCEHVVNEKSLAFWAGA